MWAFSCALALLALVSLVASAESADYSDDACPDQDGRAFIVDTPARAATIGNGFSLPSCALIIRTSIDPASMTRPTLRIAAKSVTIEGPVVVHNPIVDSRVVIVAQGGDIVVAGARVVALRDVVLECRAPDTCAVTVHRGSELRANRLVRTVARGVVKIDGALVTGGDVDAEGGGPPR